MTIAKQINDATSDIRKMKNLENSGKCCNFVSTSIVRYFILEAVGP